MSSLSPLKVIFCGTPDIGIPCLEFLSKHPAIHLCCVISQPDRPSGRGHKLSKPAVAEYALKNQIPLIQTESMNKDPVVLEKLNELRPDLMVVFAFAQLLSNKILNLPRLGCFNIHTSILPKYRGAAPIQYALLNGDSLTGVSIQKMVKKLDAGPLAQTSEIAISATDDAQSLYEKLKQEAAIALEAFIQKALNGKIILTEQDEEAVSFAPTIDKKDGFLDFRQSTTTQAQNKHRAFTPWPGTYCFLDGKRLKIIRIQSHSKKIAAPGMIKVEKNSIFIGCTDGSIEILEAQLEGKGASSSKDLINGFKGKWELTPLT